MKHRLLILVLMLGCPLISSGQPDIRLHDTDYQRLGIEFMAVQSSGTGSGEAFPALVVASPERGNVVMARHAGQLMSWSTLPGESVEEGEILAIVRSESILDTQNQWLDAQVQLEQARFELDKDTELFEAGAVSEQRLITTRRTYRQVEQQERSLRESLRVAGLDGSDLEALQMGRGLGLYPLRAPFEGSMTQRLYVAGEFIDRNSEVAVISDGRRWISARLPARVAVPLQPGQVLSLEDWPVEPVLRQKDMAIDPQSQTIGVLAEVERDGSLMTGQVVSLVVPPVEQGVLVPASAIVRFGDESVVYVREEGGVSARSLVLQSAGQAYLATEGIMVGEAVAIQGAALLKGMQLGLGGE